MWRGHAEREGYKEIQLDHNVVKGTWRQSISDPYITKDKEEDKLFPADMRNILNVGEYKKWHISGWGSCE